MILCEFTSTSAEHTQRFGHDLGSLLVPGALVLLCGELGAGKTCLSGSIARGVGVSAEIAITSPTYTLMHEYQAHTENGHSTVYHFDLYRLSDPDELDELGFDDYLHGNGVAIVEWAEHYPELHHNALHITLSWESECARRIRCVALGDFCLGQPEVWRAFGRRWVA
ncbi:MAG: tRNA (adenosine(37)-N6)-threonylcarbamoyltransferase complex ATPase subunit type 1 TsaE [Desulfuromonadaceae bacterium]|nr:tRNA (adenosine(37)-N6)-threonylcarbamoyltransferase complex ATPase subunit type 1 TsaE [Desulfuromonas sp.]MDY0184801.1 tRNA (adenosine(37)-N6)-threonylcarbamoyltransferase complex ATPase subunit type 1 TsaE [Desulfuromonadaceae bacterium]